MGRPKLNSTTLSVRLLPATLEVLGSSPSSRAREILESWARPIRSRAEAISEADLDALTAECVATGDGDGIGLVVRARDGVPEACYIIAEMLLDREA